MKKVISLLLCLLMVMSFLGACGKDTDAGTTSTDAENQDVIFNDDGTSRYRVVRPADASSEVVKAASSIILTIKKQCGLKDVKNISDDTADGADEYEILVGETNREETATARQYIIDNLGCHYLDYAILTIGKKIVIYGMTDEATLSAVTYFTQNYVKAEGVAGGITYTSATEGNFTDITVAGNSISKYVIVRPHYNSSYLTQIELVELSDYIKQTSGFYVPIVEDRYVDAGEYEIIVGNTNRTEVEEMDYDDYFIKVDGNKVYINGGTNHATAIAVSEFNKMLVANNVVSKNGDYRETLEDYDLSKQYHTTWCDEFDGDTVDLNKWNFFGPGQSDAAGVNGKTCVRSNDPRHSYVKNGKFTIAAAYDDNYYYGGMLRSNNHKTNYKYGFIEMSAIIPDGDGFWTTLWMCCEDNSGGWSPEIDVNECYGNAVKVEGNYHSWPTTLGIENGFEHYCGLHGGYMIPQTKKDDAHFGLAFHTYGFFWTPEWIGGTVDGNLYQKFDITQDSNYIDTFNDSVYLIISMATYFNNCPLTPNATEYEWEETNKLIVESIYIYQIADGKHLINGKVAE